MTSLAYQRPFFNIRCYYRPLILAVTAVILLCTFWFASRYPQLLDKAEHVGQAIPNMANSHELLPISADTPVWNKILFGAINWLDSMKLGMSFGMLLGALLHTFLRYYPLKIGNNLYLNSLKGALIGVPMGVCANCAVPTACGITRGHGRIEIALGFLFSSPNFNPVVMTMTFIALPLAMGVTKYTILLLVILFVVPATIAWLDRTQPIKPFTVDDDNSSCAIPFASEDCTETLSSVATEMAQDYAKNVWMLVKPTIVLMLLASIVSSAMLTLLPWQTLLSDITPLKLALVSVISVFMPVPIALDVMFAAQLYHQGIPLGYVMLFAMTLGTYSIIPTVYLWREVSKRLAVILFAFFVAVGWVTGLLF
ncbi:MAG: permease [Pseudomonadota bacterium]|nr:permease [Pseudomonadota bacterium]